MTLTAAAPSLSQPLLLKVGEGMLAQALLLQVPALSAGLMGLWGHYIP